MPVRLSFENKKTVLFSYTKEKITVIGLNSNFFPPYFDGSPTLQVATILVTMAPKSLELAT